MTTSTVRLLLAGVLLRPAATAGASTFAITNVRVFDGERMRGVATVVVLVGRIAAVGAEVVAPADARAVDGAGGTLLPGLIDGHVHTFGDALERAPVFGVTTVLDMFTEQGFAATKRQEQRDGRADARADLFSAGTLATAPGGHGTQYGMQFPTLSELPEADDWVAARVAEGSDYIKIVLEDGSASGRSLPTISDDIARALIAAAHRHGKLAVVHVSTARGAEVALAGGADGLVHLFRDSPADPGWVERAAKSGLFVVQTLTVLESATGIAGGAALAGDPQLKPFLRTDEIANLERSFPGRGATLDVVYASMTALGSAGIRILAGTDSPNPGTTFGASMHRELELLVAAGLTPSEALRAATSAAADAFRLGDRGRIAPGLRADLVLVDGDPTTNILDTRKIRAVWKGGAEITRTPAVEQPSGSVVVPTGVVSDFERGELVAAHGVWDRSSDAMMGGKSTVELSVTEGLGANGSRFALSARGEIRSGAPFLWAGPIYLPGGASFAPADLSASTELRFFARAPGAGSLVVMLFSGDRMVPVSRLVEVGTEWREIVLSIASFPGVDPKAVRGIHVSAAPKPGPFEFAIDQFELR